VLGRGTYIAFDDTTRGLYEKPGTTTLDVDIDPDAKLLSVFGTTPYGILAEAASLLPGGKPRWHALTDRYQERGDTPAPEAAALRQMATKAGFDGIVGRDPQRQIGAFGSGGNQVVAWNPVVKVQEQTPATAG
jgi:hypothetical protein